MKCSQRKSKPRRKYLKKHEETVSKQVCFVYADRDTVNGVRKIAPGIIKNATKEIIYIAQ